jgi:RHS repeat-associated protein
VVLRRPLEIGFLAIFALPRAVAGGEGWVVRSDFEGCKGEQCLSGWVERSMTRLGGVADDRHFQLLPEPTNPANHVVGSTVGDGDAVNPAGPDHPAPNAGRVFCYEGILIRGGAYVFRGRIWRDSGALVGLALVQPGGGSWVLAGLVPGDGGERVALSLGGGSWASMQHTGSGGIAAGRWYDLHLELSTDGTEAVFAVWLWPSGELRPAVPLAMGTLRAGGSGPWHPAIWASGPGRKLFDDLEVEYLGTIPDRHLVIEVLESGVRVPEGALFSRPVRPMVVVSGGWGPATLTAALDEGPFAQGAEVAAEGTHTIRVQASSAPPLRGRISPPRRVPASVEATLVRTFTIDRTPPAFVSLFPVSTSVVRTAAVTVTGEVSEAAAMVTVGGTPATLSGTSFMAVGVPLREGLNQVPLKAVDLAGNVGTATLLVNLDTIPPDLSVADPRSGTWVKSPQVVLKGLAGDRNLASVTVGGMPATLTGPEWRVVVALREGPNVLAVVAMDVVGNATRLTHSVNLDTGAPQIELVESGITVTGPLVLNRPAVLDARVRDACPVTVVATLGGAPHTLGTPIHAEGTHLVAVTATDAAGNESTTQTQVTLDFGAPAIAITSPTSLAIVGTPAVEVGGTCGDAVRVTVAGQPVTPSAGRFAGSAALPEEGENVVVVEATDAAGNASRASVTVVRDTSPPALQLEQPTPGTFTGFASLTVQGTVTEPHLGTVTVNGAPAQIAGSRFSAQVTLVEGVNTLRVVARDALGHTSTLERVITLDTTPPVIRVLEGGADLSEGRAYSRPVRPTLAVDDRTPTTAEVTLNGESFVQASEVRAEGRYVLRAVATDAVGNVTRVERSFRLDLTGPVVSGLAPANGSVVGGTPVGLSGACEDALTVTVNGTAAAVAGGRFALIGAPLSEGENLLNVEAMDEAGNRTTLAWRLALDTVAPALTITSPSTGTLTGSSTLTVQGMASDAHLAGVTVQGRQASMAGNTFLVQNVPLGEGSNVLEAEATDRAGHATRASVTVERDTTAPVVNIASPATGSRLGDPRVAVRGTVTDAHLEGVRVNGVAATMTGDLFEAVLTLPEGETAITAEARDRLGNVGRASATLTVDLRAPQVVITSPEQSALLRAQPVTVTGTVSGSDVQQVSVNGSAAAVSGQSFSAGAIPLLEGPNDLVARATNGAGHTGTHIVRVSYDGTGPRLATSDPVNGAIRVPRNAALSFTFSEALAPATVAPGNIVVAAGGSPVSGGLTQQGERVVFTPEAPFPPRASVEVNLGTGLTDRAGNPLAAAVRIVLTTVNDEPPPPPVLGPLPAFTNQAQLVVSGTAQAGARVTVRGGLDSGVGLADGAGHFAIQARLLPNALNMLEVTATDADGNTSLPACVQVVHDSTPPDVRSASFNGQQTATVVFSKAVDPATITASSVRLADTRGPLALSFNLDGESTRLAISLASVPATPLDLLLTTEIADGAGNRLSAEQRRRFAGSEGATFLYGEVFDDATSWPLTGATVTVVAVGGAPAGAGAPRVSTDATGRFELPVEGSPVTVRVDAPGFLSAWRTVVPEPGVGNQLFDLRLTPVESGAPPSPAPVGSIAATAGVGASPHPESLGTAALTVRVTKVSTQALPDLLPVGWGPLGVVRVEVTGGTLSGGITIEIALPFAPSSAAWVARFDETVAAWLAHAPATGAVGDNLPVVVSTPGWYAALEPDPPPDGPGVAVAGMPLPSSSAPDPAARLSAMLTLEPSEVLPSQRSLATVVVTADRYLPSGTPVHATLDERLRLVGGQLLVEPPLDCDLILYRRGAQLRAEFSVAPSPEAARVPLDIGTKRVAILQFPPGVRTSDLVGPGGGTVISGDGSALQVPADALGIVTSVNVRGVRAEAMGVPLPVGLAFLGAAEVRLGGHTLELPATLSLPDPQPGASSQVLVLVPLATDGASRWRFVGVGTREHGRLVAGPNNAQGLPAPWVRGEGTFVFASADPAWGLLSGRVIAVGGAPEPDALVACAVGTRDPVLAPDVGDLVQLTGRDGSFALAGRAGSSSVGAVQLTTRDQGQASLVLAAGQTTSGVEVRLLAVPPRVVAVSPLPGASGVPQATAVTVDFSEPLNPASVNLDTVLAVTALPGGTWPGRTELSRDARRLSFTPARSFPSAAAVRVVVSGSIRDLAGYPLAGGEFAFAFTVERVILANDLRPERILLYAPCISQPRCEANPRMTGLVHGLPGALPNEVACFVEDLSRQTPTTTAQALQDGSLEIPLDPSVVVGDDLLLHVLAGNGREVTVRLQPWLAADGQGAVVGQGGGRIVTRDGVAVDVPSGALAKTEAVRVITLDATQTVQGAVVPEWAQAVAAVRLEGATAPELALGLSLPAPALVSGDRPLLVAMEVMLGGQRRLMVLDTARLEPDPVDPARKRIVSGGGALDGGVAKASGRTASLATVRPAVTDPNDKLPGIIAWGTYLVFQTPVDLTWLSGSSAQVGSAVAVQGGFVWIPELMVDLKFLLPTRRDSPYRLQVLRPNGFVNFEEGYGAPQVSVFTFPGVVGGDRKPPAIVGGGPFRVYAFTATPGRMPLDAGITAVLANGAGQPLQVTIDPDLLPAGTQAELFTLGSPGADLRTVLKGSAVQLSLAASAGDRMLLAIEARGVALDTPLRVVFSEPVRPETFRLAKPVGSSQSNGPHDPPDDWKAVDATTYELRPEGGWHPGTSYVLTLPAAVSDLEDPPQSLGSVVRLRFGTGDLHQWPSLAVGAVSGVVRQGNVAVVAAGEQGLVAFDISDIEHPARLNEYEFMHGSPARDVATDGWGLVAGIAGTVDGPDALALIRLSDLVEVRMTAWGAMDQKALTPIENPQGMPVSVACESRELVDALTPAHPGPIVVIADAFGVPFQVYVPATALFPNHPVRLEDAVTGELLWQGFAPDPRNDVIVPLSTWPREPNRPLRLRRHRDTLIHVAVSGGDVSTWAAQPSAQVLEGHTLVGWKLVQLAVWHGDPTKDPAADCRTASGEDVIFHRRVLPVPARFDRQGAVARSPLVLDLTYRQGVLPLRLDEVADAKYALRVAEQPGPLCVRTEGAATRVSDAAFSAGWRGKIAGQEQEVDLLALLSGDQLVLYELGSQAEWIPWGVVRLPSAGARVGLDPARRLALVADAGGVFYVVDLSRLDTMPPGSGPDPRVVGRIDFGGGGNADLLVDPTIGLALFGKVGGGLVPVAYAPPPLEVVTDADGDGVPEKASVLQALGSPRAAADAEGRRPGVVAWLVAHAAGAGPQITARFQALHAAGGALPVHPEGLTPTAREIPLRRVASEVSNPGASVYVSPPFVLIADERARGGVYRDPATTQAERDLCRDCDRKAVYGIPWDQPSGAEPLLELAAGDTVRFSLEPTGALSVFKAEELERAAVSVRSTRWEISPAPSRPAAGNAIIEALPEVDLAGGSVELAQEDLALPAPGQDLVVSRAFTSGGVVVSPLGVGWDFTVRLRLRENLDGSVDLYDAYGHRFAFAVTGGRYVPPADIFGDLVRTPEGWELHLPGGDLALFDRSGLLVELRDRSRVSEKDGSSLRLDYTPGGVPMRISHRAPGSKDDRWIALTVDTRGVVTGAEDGIGRKVTYLIGEGAMRLERVEGVNITCGVDTPGRPAWTMTYVGLPSLGADGLGGRDHLLKASQLATMTDPANRPALALDYNVEAVARVRRGELSWTVDRGVPGQARVTDAMGNRTLAVWDAGGHLTRLVEGEGAAEQQATAFVRNAAGLATEVTLPSGGKVHSSYDSANPELTARANLLDQRRIPDPLPGGQDDASPPAPLVTTYAYQPGTNLPVAVTRPGPNGPLTTTISRDGTGNATRITSPDGTSVSMSYDALGRVASRAASTGTVTTIAYDDLGSGSGEARTVVTTSSAGRSSTTFVRDAQGNALETETEDGVSPTRRTTSTYNEMGWALQTASTTSVSTTTYDAAGTITRITTQGNGQEATSPAETTEASYTDAGMIRSITRSQGGTRETTTLSYDAAGRLARSDAAGVTTAYSYDALGRTRTRSEGGLVTSFTYDAAGRLEKTLTPSGKLWQSLYDRFGRSVGRVDPTGVREEMALAPDGSPVARQLRDPQGALWSREEYAYDHAGRQTASTVHRFRLPPSSGADDQLLTSTTSYYASGPQQGLVQTITDAARRTTELAYDDAGRETERHLPDGTVVGSAYLPDGKLSARTVAYPGQPPLVTRTDYDQQGRPWKVTDAGGHVTTTMYDALGRRTAEIRDDSEPEPATSRETPVQRVSTWEYGELGRTVTEQRPDGAKITRTTDARGNLIAYADGEGATTRYEYDAASRLTRITYPDASHRDFAYTPDGELATLTKADGSAVSFAYDGAGRLMGARVVQVGSASPSLDHWSASTTFGYDPVGHMTSAANGAVEEGFVWDSVGNQLSESLRPTGSLAPGFGTRTITRTFDLANRPASLLLPDGTPYLQRLYDVGDRLTGLVQRTTAPAGLGDPAGGTVLWQAQYAGDRLLAVARGNGLLTKFAYNPEGDPTEVATGRADPQGAIAAPMHRLALSWTAGHLRRSKAMEDLERTLLALHYDQVGHLETGNGIPAIAQIDRDLQAILPPAVGSPLRLREDWAVSPVDVLVSKARTSGGRQDLTLFEANTLHQVTQAGATSYAWDLDGNLQRKTTGSVEDVALLHDWRDRLVQVRQGSAVTDLVVDPLGRLVAEVSRPQPGASIPRIFLHDGEQVVGEYVQGRAGVMQLERRHHWGRWIDELVVEEVDADHDGTVETTLYPVSDLLGDVRLLTDSDGRIKERIVYEPDGRPVFFREDTIRPTVTRLAWTGTGQSPAGDAVAANVFEIGLSEVIDVGSVSQGVATMAAAGQPASAVTITLRPDLRTVVATGFTLQAGAAATLHLEGLKDRSGNLLVPVDQQVTLSDPTAYTVLADTAPPKLLDVLDASDGLVLLVDEPVIARQGSALAEAVTVKRAGDVVPGTVTRLSGTLLKWQPTNADTWILGGDYTLTGLDLSDLAPSPKAISDPHPITFTHLAESPTSSLIAYAAPTDSAPSPSNTSAYGLTTLFQGRTWHPALGLYHYRARWYDPQISNFIERDPVGYLASPNPYGAFSSDPQNFVDPRGRWSIDFHFYAIFYLSMAAGLAAEDATQLAWASQYVDEDQMTRPTVGNAVGRPDALKAFHFPAKQGEVTRSFGGPASANMERAMSQSGLIGKGIALHVLADSFAHEGFRADFDPRNMQCGGRIGIGHADCGQLPDMPFLHTQQAMGAARSVFTFLESITREKHNPVILDWPEIALRVEEVFSFIGSEEERCAEWQKAIWKDFEVRIDYRALKSPASWRRLFSGRAKQQMDFLLEVEGEK